MLDIKKSLRVNKDTDDKVKELMKSEPEIYGKESVVYRSAIHQLYKQKILKGGKNF